jgi:hypothetical protein
MVACFSGRLNAMQAKMSFFVLLRYNYSSSWLIVVANDLFLTTKLLFGRKTIHQVCNYHLVVRVIVSHLIKSFFACCTVTNEICHVVCFKASPISVLITHFLDFSTDFLFTILIRFLIFIILIRFLIFIILIRFLIFIIY